MSSGFDKAYDVAAANQRESEQLKAAEERETQRNLSDVRSLADPYLRDLGTKVVQKLLALKIPPQKLVIQKRSFLKGEKAFNWWSFSQSPPYDTTSDINRIELILHENGMFYQREDWGLSKGTREHRGFMLVQPAVCQLEQALSMNSYDEFRNKYGVFGDTQTFVDPNTRVVYIIASRQFDLAQSLKMEQISQGRSGPIMELSAYIAHKVQSYHRTGK